MVRLRNREKSLGFLKKQSADPRFLPYLISAIKEGTLDPSFSLAIESDEKRCKEENLSRAARQIFSRLPERRDARNNATICLKSEAPGNLTADVKKTNATGSRQTIGTVTIEVLKNVGSFFASTSACWIWRAGRAVISFALEKNSKPSVSPSAPWPKSPRSSPDHRRQNISPPRTPPFPFFGPSLEIGVIPVGAEIRLPPPVLFQEPQMEREQIVEASDVFQNLARKFLRILIGSE